MTDQFVRRLQAQLAGAVRDDGGTLAAYSGDASNHRVAPRCVVFPTGEEDVWAALELCRADGVPITCRGGGTNVAGNAIGAGVVLDFSRGMAGILQINPEEETAVVQPGVVLDTLRAAAARHGLTFGADPSTHDRATLGGMIGTNACGPRSVAWGTTADNVQELTVLLSDGTRQVLRARATDSPTESPLDASLASIAEHWQADIRRELGRFPRQVSGYALHHLLPENGCHAARAFVGSEGTCAVVTEARLRLVRTPHARTLLVAGFPDHVAAAAATVALLDLAPLTVEGMNEDLVRAFESRPGPHRRPPLPAGRAWLLLEFGGETPAEARAQAEQARRAAMDAGALAAATQPDPEGQRALWRVRERGAGLATRTVDGREAWPGWEDAAVPPNRLAAYLTDFGDLLKRHGRQGVIYGHFGEGCVHVRIDHDLLTPDGRRAYRAFQEDAADLVVAHGGSLSGEHGDGLARSELLPRMYGNGVLAAFAAFKRAFDPPHLLNPGVIVAPRPLDADLRAAISRPHRTELAFHYESDGGDLGRALRRCVGVGACRKEAGGGMCPSFRATRDERHSTRGRARILAEMLDGQLQQDSWRSTDARNALDLCLMCKACRSECPVAVDMATYKAEFLHHHYRGRLRPRSHYSMGWLPLWLALARRAPRLANRLLDLPGVATAARWVGGIDQRRALPRLAPAPFRRGIRRSTPPMAGDPVLLWVDTFNATFHPQAIHDAAAVLQAAGYAVRFSSAGLCCGLTWISTGQLDVARRVLRRTVSRLDRTATPVVVLEPSCATVLRADATELVGGAAAARVADRVRTLAEVLDGRTLPLAPAPGDAVVQFHCHQRSVLGTGPDLALLHRLGLSVRTVDDGCCGLAGNFGFEAGHYDVSVRCAEQSFLPILREGDDETLVIADGYSCRLQIEQVAGRQARHLAEVLRAALVEQEARSPG